MTIRVLLADDQTLIRSGFRVLVNSAPDLEVVAEASNGREAVELARTERADVVLMDIRMPEVDGLAATRMITADEALAGREGADPDHVRGGRVRLRRDPRRRQRLPRQERRAGRADRRDPRGRPRRRAAVPEGRPRPDQPLPRRAAARPGRSDPTVLDVLTDREREIVGLVALGLSNDEIAERLVLSPSTAKTHVNRAMVKLDCRDRAQLVVLAYQTGLVRQPGVPQTQ